jgi:multidrug efflux pump subunit AcrA (membrane-fusion protein)
MRVRVTVLNPDRTLKPEMFAMVRVFASPQPEALAVPLAAVQQDGTGKMLFVRQPANRFEPRRVILGDELDGKVLVLEGLREGEDVVVKGAFAIKSEFDIHKIEPTP